MKKEKLQEAILRYLREQAVGKKIEADTPLLESGVLDSFGIVQLIVYLEQQQGITLGAEEVTAEHFATVHSIVDLLQRR